MSLKAFFQPKSIAVIGASHEPSKLGHAVLKNILDSKYEGEVFPINPKGGIILKQKVYGNISELPTTPELAVIVIPAAFVLQVVKECGERGVRSVVVISAGFKEAGAAGQELEQQLVEICKTYDMRLIGPNCLGLIASHHNLNASFAAGAPASGAIALTSQSGALGTAILDTTTGNPLLGLSYFVSLGNKADVNEIDLFPYFANDSKTKVILSYCESLSNGPEFIRVAKAVTQHKPIVMLKSGRTDSGQKAVSSHTGSLAGSDAAYAAALKQSGIIRAETLEEFFDFGLAFAHLPLITGSKIAVVTNAGGPAILATDALEKNGLHLAELHNVTEMKLAQVLPPSASVHNPVDILGDALSDRYKLALNHVIKDKAVDAIIVILTPQSMTEIEQTAAVVAQAARNTALPIVTCFMGDTRVEPGINDLIAEGVPNYPFPERAVSALAALHRYAEWQNTPRPYGPRARVDQDRATLLLASARQNGLNVLPALQAQSLLKAYAIKGVPTKLATSATQAVEFAKDMEYPVVLKIESPDILHKTEFKGVKVGLQTGAAVETAYHNLITAAKHHLPSANISGCVVQKQVGPGTELIIGMKRDPQFGPLIAFGLGGIYVEALRDISFRIAPFGKRVAQEMIFETKASHLLTGQRGQPSVDIDELIEILIKVSRLVTEHPEIQELDLNPVIATPKNIWAVDARVMI